MSIIYTRFPNRGAGIGLLLLRVAIGVTLILHAGLLLQFQESRIAGVAIVVIALFSGLALLAGFLTPIVSVVAFLIVAGTGFSRLAGLSGGVIAGYQASLDVVVMAAAIVLLGPGAFSVDAHLFGRRKIIIPPPSPSERA